MVLKRSEFKQAAKESSVYKTRFTLPPGRYLVEVWIKDVLGDAASFQNVLVVLPKPDSGMQIPNR